MTSVQPKTQPGHGGCWKVFIRFLGPQSVHNGKVLSYQDKAVMVTRLVPTLRGSVSLQNYADSAYADTYAAMFVSGYISGPVQVFCFRGFVLQQEWCPQSASNAILRCKVQARVFLLEPR
ncbi:hypothetical protein EMCRGX_G015580 [Ephydatia muelleri]